MLFFFGGGQELRGVEELIFVQLVTAICIQIRLLGSLVFPALGIAHLV